MNPKENPLMYFFYITKTIERILAERVQQECGVTHSDGKILITIGSCGSVNQAMLAGLLDVSAPAISRKIDRLVAKGYVTKITNPDNRRSQDINLTSEGTKVFKKTHTYLKSTLQEILQDIGGVSKVTEQELESITAHFKSRMSEQELCIQEVFEKNK